MSIIYAVINFVSAAIHLVFATLNFITYSVINVGFVLGATFVMAWFVVNLGEQLCVYYRWLNNEKVTNRTMLATIVLTFVGTIVGVKYDGVVSTFTHLFGIMVVMFLAYLVAMMTAENRRSVPDYD